MIHVEDWNDDRGIAHPKKEECRKLNNYLEQLRSSFVACHREMTLQKKEITVETVKKQYYGKNDEEYTLCKLMNYHNIEMKEAPCWGTMNYFTTQKYLEKYLKLRKHTSDILLVILITNL